MRKLTATECVKVNAWQDQRVALGLEAAIPLDIPEQKAFYVWLKQRPEELQKLYGLDANVEPEWPEPWITIEQILAE